MNLPVICKPPGIRLAGPDELDALVRLEHASFDGDRMSRGQYRRHLASSSAQVLVAVDAKRSLLGSAVVFFREGSGVARLYSLATDPAARGNGVASALLAAVEAAARLRHCRCVRLEVRRDNAAAIALYERSGYRRTGFLESYYEDGADGWRYEKRLATNMR